MGRLEGKVVLGDAGHAQVIAVNPICIFGRMRSAVCVMKRSNDFLREQKPAAG